MKSKKEKNEQIRVICVFCRKFLNGREAWVYAEGSTSGENKELLSHGICPTCLQQHYPNEYLAIQEERKIRIRDTFKEDYTKVYGYRNK